MNKERKVVVVLGMHRSGTSALMGIVNKLGVFVGNNLIEPVKGVNDKGFWEDKSILETHNKLYESLSLDWDGVFDSSKVNWSNKLITNHINKLDSIIANDFIGHEIWGFKDPRTCRLLPVWKTLFKNHNIKPIYLIIYRHPSEVVKSLAHRDGLDKQHSLLLWLLHNLDAEYYTRTSARIFVNYSSLINNTNIELSKISKHLSENNVQSNFTNNKYIIDFIDPSLKHHNINSTKTSKKEGLYNFSIQYYLLLENLSKGITNDSEINLFRDNFFKYFNTFSKLLENQFKKSKLLKDTFYNAEEIIKNYEFNQSELNKIISKTQECYQKTQEVLLIKDKQLSQNDEYVNSLKKYISEYVSNYESIVKLLNSKDLQISEKEKYNNELFQSYNNLENIYNETLKSLEQRDKQLKNEYKNSTSLLANYDNTIQILNETMTALNIMENNLNETLKNNELLEKSRKELEKEYLETINNLKKHEIMIIDSENKYSNMNEAYNNLENIYKKTTSLLDEKFLEIEELTCLVKENEEKLESLTSIENAINKNKIVNKEETSEEISHNNISTNEYETNLNLLVENSSHSKMFRIIEENCHNKISRILEVGCSTGFFGALLKDFGHEVWGIEIDPKTAEVARSRIDKVFTGTIEEFLNDSNLLKLEFDYITFGDVLEHLVNPLDVLKKCKKILSDKGAIVISIPNIAHISIRTMLSTGKWTYNECGIMDRTHLRFFTKDSLIELFTDAGYCIDVIDRTIVGGNETETIVDPNTLDIVKKLSNDDEQEVFQYILSAKPSNQSEIIERNIRFNTLNQSKILCLLPFADWSIGNIRIRDPLDKYCSVYGGALRILQSDKWTPEDIAWADTIVFQREVNIPMLGIIEMFQKLGKRIIFDIDDLLTEVPSFLISHESCENSKPFLEEAFRMADAVTVTTETLKNELLKYTNRIHVIPNCAKTLYPPTKHYDSTDPVNILIASSDSVRVDFVYETLHKLVNNKDINIKIIAIGPPGEALESEKLTIEWHPNMTYDHFKAFLATLDNTVGVIPLDDSKFSSCKSAIKYLDYSLAGIPTISSDLLPYSGVINNGINGILCENESDSWYNSILELIISIDKRSSLAKSARMYVNENFSLRNSADAWESMFINTQAGMGQQGTLLTDIPRSEKLTNFAKLCIKPRKYKEALDLLINEGPSSVKNRISKHF